MNNEDLLSREFLISAFGALKKTKKQYKTYILLDNASKLYKIGRATNVEKRLSSLTVANPSLSIILVIDANVENRLHKEYASNRVKSEWFKLSEDDIRSINDKYNNEVYE
jgi:hypothetical protein